MKKKPSLLFCLVMDGIGFLTYSIPMLGELGDILWAPVSAIIFFITFVGRRGLIGALFNFIEEALPFLDFIPSFTIAWLYLRFSDTRKQQDSYPAANKSLPVNQFDLQIH